MVLSTWPIAVGPITPHVYYGYDKAENTDVYVGDKYNVRQMYGVGVNWKIADSFYIVPEFTYYDYGKDAKRKATPTSARNGWAACSSSLYSNPTLNGNPGEEKLHGLSFPPKPNLNTTITMR